MKTRTGGSLFIWSLVACSFVGAQTRASRPEIACQGHADGLYVINPQACNDGFYKCANGRSFYYQCPQGLFFSTEDAQCEYKQTIPACGGVRPAQSAPQQPVAPVAVVHKLVAPAIPAQPINPIYPISYVQSPAPQPAAPIAPVQAPQYEQPTQPPTTTYTPPTASAYTTQAPTAAPAPIAIETTTPPQVYQPPVQQQYIQPAPVAPVQTTTTEAPYVEPAAPAPSSPVALVANPNEYVASTEQPYLAPTPPPTTPPAPVAPVAQPAPSYSAPPPPAPYQQQAAQPNAPIAAVQQQIAPEAAVRPVSPSADFKCGANADGYYFKQPCTSSYYSCVGGQAIKLNCPASLVFDPQVKSCDYANVCGKPRPPSTTTQQPPSTPPPSTHCVGKSDGFYVSGRCQSKYLHCTNGVAYELTCPAQLAFNGQQCTYREDCLNPTTPAAPVAPVQTTPAVPRSQWCQQNNKPDGTHGHGCSPKFYACGGGFTTEINCPAGLVYDSTTQSCDQRQFVAACGGKRPITTTTIAAPVAPVRPVNFNCADKGDGYHGSGCASSYYSCIGGKAGELACPVGTRYSSQLHTCDWPQNVPECGGQIPTTPVTAPIAPAAPVAQSSYGYAPAPVTPAAPIAPVQEPQYEQPTQPPPPPPSTVTYTPPTAPVYTTQAPTIAPAPVAIQTTPQVYQAPVYQPPATTQPPTTPAPVYQPPQTVAAPVYAPPPQQPIAPIAPVASPDDYDANPCEKLPDGIYGRRCSRHYFVCSVNKTYEFTCPQGYAYDRQLARCGPKSGIPTCSSATPVVSAPQAAVAPYSSG